MTTPDLSDLNTYEREKLRALLAAIDPDDIPALRSMLDGHIACEAEVMSRPDRAKIDPPPSEGYHYGQEAIVSEWLALNGSRVAEPAPKPLACDVPCRNRLRVYQEGEPGRPGCSWVPDGSDYSCTVCGLHVPEGTRLHGLVVAARDNVEPAGITADDVYEAASMVRTIARRWLELTDPRWLPVRDDLSGVIAACSEITGALEADVYIDDLSTEQVARIFEWARKQSESATDQDRVSAKLRKEYEDLGCCADILEPFIARDSVGPGVIEDPAAYASALESGTIREVEDVDAAKVQAVAKWALEQARSQFHAADPACTDARELAELIEIIRHSEGILLALAGAGMPAAKIG